MAKKYYKPLPVCVTIKESEIEGLGLFACGKIEAGYRIGMTHFKTDDENFVEEGGWARLPLGGWINHSEKPNTKFSLEGNYLYLDVLDNDILPGDEITATYLWYDPTDL